MGKFFELIMMAVCLILFFVAAVATPASIIYGLYLWGGEGHELGKLLRIGY